MHGPLRHHAVEPSPTPTTYHSLTIPTRLLTDLSDTPLAIGVYSLVARLFVIAHAPVPLSTGDVQRYDPAPSRSALMRAFARLVRGGWLVAQTTSGGKTCYTPTWGMVGGAPRAWRMGATLLDRPRRTQVVLLNKRLLDTCLGKLLPHVRNPATIERYLTRPLLGLSDIGVYLLLDHGGRVQPTEPLRALGLVQGEHIAPLAADHDVLARASQHMFRDPTDRIALTKKGILKFGCHFPDTAPTHATAQTPFFCGTGHVRLHDR